MQKACIVVSPFCLWNEHLTFESWVLELLLGIKYSKIILIGEKDHLRRLRKMLPHVSIIYRSYSYKNRLFLGIHTIFLVFFLNISRKNKIFFLSFEHPHLIFLIALLFRNSVWFLHNYGWKNFFVSAIKKFGYKFFIFRNKSVVLGEWIYKNMPFYRNNFFIYHPIPSFISNFWNVEKKKQVVIFPSHNHRFIPEGKINYFIEQIQSQGFQVVRLGWSKRQLNMDDYYTQLAESQFCVLLSGGVDYKLRCSGSIFDAMAVGTFIYGLESDMSRSLLIDFWNIGFFVKDLEHIFASIGSVSINCNIDRDIWDTILQKNISLITKILS